MYNNSLKNCYFIKTVLLFLVIVYHSCVFWTGIWWESSPVYESIQLKLLADCLNTFHIYAFTLVSGYLFAFKVSKGGYNNFFAFIKNKAKRLLVPYLFVTVIWLVPLSVLLFHFDLNRIFKSYVICINPEQLWFLWMLFGVFIIIWPIRRLLIKYPQLGYGLAVLSYVLGLLGRRVLPNVFQIWTATQFLTFFFIGMRIRIKEEKGQIKITERIPWYCWIILHIILFISTQYIDQQSGKVWEWANLILRYMLHITGALMAWTTLQSFTNFFLKKNDQRVVRLARYSMPMFLFHQQFVYFSIIVFDGKLNPWIHFLVNFLVAFIGSLLLSVLLSKWKWTRIMIGEKP